MTSSKKFATFWMPTPKPAGYTLVLDISGESANMAPVVLFSSGANDLTDNLIKELNAGAPPMTRKTRRPPG